MERKELQKLADDFIKEMEINFKRFEERTGIIFTIISKFEHDNLCDLHPNFKNVCRQSKYKFHYHPHIMKEDNSHLTDIYDSNVF